MSLIKEQEDPVEKSKREFWDSVREYNDSISKDVVSADTVQSNQTKKTPDYKEEKSQYEIWKETMLKKGYKPYITKNNSLAFRSGDNSLYYDNGRFVTNSGQKFNYSYKYLNNNTKPQIQTNNTKPQVQTNAIKGDYRYHTEWGLMNDFLQNKLNLPSNVSIGDAKVHINNDPKLKAEYQKFRDMYIDEGIYGYRLKDQYRESKRSGGIINSYKTGNKMNNEQELQKAFMMYLIKDAAAQGVQIQSEQDLQAYAQQLGEEGLKIKYQEFMQKMQGEDPTQKEESTQGIKAALGAKLNYIKKIKGICPDGQETYFFKEGGSIKSGCKPCMAKAQKAQKGKQLNAVQDFKNNRKHINPNDTVWADGDKNKARTLTDDRNRPIVKGMKPYSAEEYQRDMAKGRKGDKAAARRAEKQDEKTMYACGGKSKKKK